MNDSTPLVAFVGAIIRIERQSRSLLQRDIADASGLNMNVVARAEIGKHRDMDLNTISRIAAGLSAFSFREKISAGEILVKAERWRYRIGHTALRGRDLARVITMEST